MKIMIDLDLPKEKNTQFIFGEHEGKRFSIIVHDIEELDDDNVITLAKAQIPPSTDNAKIEIYYKDIRGKINEEIKKFKIKEEDDLF